jgi:hypothetical protein
VEGKIGLKHLTDRQFQKLCLIVILILAAAVRFYGLDWDSGIGAHPDERYLVGVAEGLRWPQPLNPFDISPDYAYGHLPLYLLTLTLNALPPTIDPLLLGRALAALFDLGTVALTFALGRYVYLGEGEERIGLLAAAFVALMVLHVQQAHFYTADGPLTFFVLGSLLFAVRLARDGRPADAWLMGAWGGLALGTKASAGLLLIPLSTACLIAPLRMERRGYFWRYGAAVAATFALCNPFALLDFSTFWRNVSQQAAIVRGALDLPYTRQFHATWPYLYSILQQLRWGMGWALGLPACGGLAYAVWRLALRARLPLRAEWVLLAWALPYFSFVGALYAKFPRYLLPLTPLLAIYAARLLIDAAHRWRAFSFLTYAVLICALLHCAAFLTIYHEPHPWHAASEWLYQHAEPGAVIAVEHWDHPLPLNATGYDVRELPIFDEETPEKWERMEQTLAAADYIVIASRRGYAALARSPERYPRTTRYYGRLFRGELGFEPVACFGRYPRLGPVTLLDDPTQGLDFSLPALCHPDTPFTFQLGRLDESFVVYDHPQAIIFRRTGVFEAIPKSVGMETRPT